MGQPHPGYHGYPGAPMPPRRSKVGWILGGLGLGVLVLIVGAVFVVKGLGGPSDANTPEAVAERFLSASKDRDIDTMKKNSCAKDVEIYSRAQGQSNPGNQVASGRLDSWDIEGTNISGDGGTVRVRIKGKAGDGRSIDQTISLPVQREGGKWTVCATNAVSGP
jgi:hypothetical protein